jgi:TonB-dependent SusC/RagA subfamily outer membrane receptor
MKKLIFSLVLPFIVLSLFAQQTRNRNENNPPALKNQPLIIVNSLETDFNHLLIKPDNIESINVLKDSASVAVYGEKGKYGVIIIQPKKGSDLVQMPELITLYNIRGQDLKLKVALDHILVKDVNKLIIDKNDIRKVEVVTETLWYSALEAGTEERYINIEMKKDKLMP